MTGYIKLTSGQDQEDNQPHLGYAYRCFERHYAPSLDEFDNPISGSGRVEVIYDRFPIVRRTPKGVWIDNYGERKFILLTANKKFACETLEQARESFVARKRRQIRILTAGIRSAEQAIALVERNQISDCLI